MGLASDIKKKIEKKMIQINDLEAQKASIDMQIREATAALQAFQEILKITPADSSDEERSEPKIRPGSVVALARDALRKNGSPMHVTKLLEAIGKPVTHESRVSFSGSLSAYYRNGQIFTRPQPNVFGLLEWETQKDAAFSPEEQAIIDKRINGIAVVSK